MQRRSLHLSVLCARALTALQHRVLPRVHKELPGLQSVPVAPCPGTGHYGTELGPILLTPPYRYSPALLRSPQPSPSVQPQGSPRVLQVSPPSLHPPLGSPSSSPSACSWRAPHCVQCSRCAQPRAE